MTFLPTFLAGANFVMHSAGWLEGGLVSCYEKFIVDIELLRELRHEFTPLEIDEASLAFSAHEEVGAGGHFLGAAHTLERFRECFYRPLLSSTENFDRWTKKGGRDATARAGEIWRATLESYEQPPLDEAIRAELEEFVDRRRTRAGGLSCSRMVLALAVVLAATSQTALRLAPSARLGPHPGAMAQRRARGG